MLTPEHKVDLLKTALAVLPATLVSLWALISQRSQNRPQLEVVISPIFLPTIDGNSVLGDEWPGMAVRNQSSFPLRICNVGLRIGKKFFEFGTPLGGNLKETDWPYEIAPRARVGFYFNERADYGHRFANAISPELKGKLLWERARAYVMTECGRTFTSTKLSRKSLRELRKAVKERSKAFPEAPPNQIIQQAK
jgi:hypothetical protein